MQSFEGEWNMLSYIGGKMRLRILLVLAVICMAVCFVSSFAAPLNCYSTTDTCYVCWDTTGTPWALQELDLGICDTVRIGCPVCANFSEFAVGDSFAVPIYLYSSNAIGAFTLGFRHTGRSLHFSYVEETGGWDPTGGMIPLTQWGGVQYSMEESSPGVVKADSGAALLGWVDLSGKKPLARNTTGAAKLLGHVYLTLADQVTQTIRFDSTYFPPSGPFILSCRDSSGGSYIDKKLTPKFVICEEVQAPPCDINLPVADVNIPALPQKFDLSQNVPNPFNPNTAITFAVPRPSQVRIDVFNVMGQRVRTLADEYSKAGYKRVEWDGTDANGNSVASGVYLYRMTAGDFSETKKMLLLK